MSKVIEIINKQKEKLLPPSVRLGMCSALSNIKFEKQWANQHNK